MNKSESSNKINRFGQNRDRFRLVPVSFEKTKIRPVGIEL